MPVSRIHLATRTLFRLNGRETWMQFFLKQLFLFGYLQAVSCFFPLVIFSALYLSHYSGTVIPRYDLLFIVLVVVQLMMYLLKLETRDELLVICLFHLLGVILEWHKVNQGSWTYPESAVTKWFGVPLYAGFMYASVGSYICQVWRNLDLKLVRWPGMGLSAICGVLIYLNFFTNAFIPDMRVPISVALLFVFRRAGFSFSLNGYRYTISALTSFLLVGFFIWLAENVATFFGAWQYAYQHRGWRMVSWHKITSWSLLVIVSIIIVAELKRIKEKHWYSA